MKTMKRYRLKKSWKSHLRIFALRADYSTTISEERTRRDISGISVENYIG